MTKPYRVVVWGPGGLGSVCISEILRNPEFELVGVRAYAAAKHGMDAGTLIGIGPCGVAATSEPQEALKIDCDCVVYTARDHGNYHNDAEILQILAAGKNLVTALPYQHVRLVREPAFVESLEEACRTGRSTFHATGVDPDVIGDRVLLALTGLCNDVSQIRLQEVWDSSYTPADTLKMCGFGKTPEEARQMPVAEKLADNFLRQVGLGMGEALGIEFTKIEINHDYVATSADLDCATMPISAGTVGRVTHRWSGFTGLDTPFFTVEVNWILGETMLPPGAQPNQYWIATIEGRPSVRLTVDIKASMTSGERFLNVGGAPSEPGYHATIAACLQAIPLICKAAPGILPVGRPPVHWHKPVSNLQADLRPAFK